MRDSLRASSRRRRDRALRAAPAAAQEWPRKPIRMLVGFGAGGGTDIVARIIAQPLSEALGQQVVIENKPGAGSTLASDKVAKAPKGRLHRRDDERGPHRVVGDVQVDAATTR